MTVRTYLAGMAASTIFCFVSWALVVIYVDPVTTNLIGIGLFYLSLFFFLAGLFAIMGFYLRRRIFRNETEFIQAETAFRQGVFLSLVFAATLALQNLRTITWWNILLVILGVSLLELYFASKK